MNEIEINCKYEKIETELKIIQREKNGVILAIFKNNVFLGYLTAHDIINYMEERGEQVIE